MTTLLDDELVVIRCKNWDEEPEVCHIDCGIAVTREEIIDTSWISVVLETHPEWFIMLRACSEHGRHADPYCCIACFERYHSRHDHLS